MSPESSYLDPEKNLSFEKLRQELRPQLLCFATEQTERIDGILANGPNELDVDACVKSLSSLLNEKGVISSLDSKRQITDKVLDGYPEAYRAESTVLTPKKYLERVGGDTSMRPNLRSARDKAINESQALIKHRMDEDDTHRELQIIPSDERLHSLIEQKIQSAQNSIIESADSLEDIWPTKTATLAMAQDIIYNNIPDNQSQEVVDHIMSTFQPILANGGTVSVLELDSMPEYTICSYVNIPRDEEHAAEIKSSYSQLEKHLDYYANLTPAKLAKEIANELNVSLSDRQAARLTQALASIVIEELKTLDEKVQASYEKVPQRRQTRSQENQSNPRKRPKTSESSPIQRPETAKSTETSEIQRSSLGPVELDLAWTEQKAFEVELIKQNGHRLLIIDAMSAKARALSDELRSKNQDTAKSLDNIWEKAKETVLTRPQDNHHKKVRNLNNQEYDGVSVVYTGNVGANPKRVYFGKACASKFEKLSVLAAENGLKIDTNVLFLIAETDKKHQIRTYKDEFGITQAQARAGNVGS